MSVTGQGRLEFVNGLGSGLCVYLPVILEPFVAFWPFTPLPREETAFGAAIDGVLFSVMRAHGVARRVHKVAKETLRTHAEVHHPAFFRLGSFLIAYEYRL